MKLWKDLIVQCHLVSADRTPIRRIKRENQGSAAEVAQGNQLVGGTVEVELGRARTGCERRSDMLVLLFTHGLELLMCKLVLNNQGGNRSRRNGNVLFNHPRAGSHGSDNVSAKHDRNAATEDNYFSGIAFLNAEKRFTWLREPGQSSRWFIEDSCRNCLIDCEIDAADKRTILTHEGHQMAASIDHRDIVRNSQA